VFTLFHVSFNVMYFGISKKKSSFVPNAYEMPMDEKRREKTSRPDNGTLFKLIKMTIRPEHK